MDFGGKRSVHRMIHCAPNVFTECIQCTALHIPLVHWWSFVNLVCPTIICNMLTKIFRWCVRVFLFVSFYSVYFLFARSVINATNYQCTTSKRPRNGVKSETTNKSNRSKFYVYPSNARKSFTRKALYGPVWQFTKLILVFETPVRAQRKNISIWSCMLVEDFPQLLAHFQ